MKTVFDICTAAIAMRSRGLTARQVADQILQLGHDNGFAAITERGSLNHSGVATIELVFRLGGTIYFDGFDWHYLKT